MAISGGVRVEGLNRLTRDLQALGLDIDDLKDAFADIADEGARLAAGFAPVRTGRLRSTIRGNRAKNKAVVAAGRGRTRYAGPINYGWPKRNIAPALFMQKADEAMQPKALARLDESITDAIHRRGLS